MPNLVDLNAMDPQNLMLAQQAGAVAPAPVPVQTAVDANGIPVAVPSTVTTTTQPSESSGRSSTQTQVTPELANAQANVRQLGQQEKEAVQAKTGAAVAQEAITSQGADQEAQARAAYDAERERLRQQNQDRTAQLMAEQRAAREEMRTSKPTTYDEDMGPVRKVLTALSLGMGAYGSSITGGPNTAFQIYQSHIEQDRKKKEAILAGKASRLADATNDTKAGQDLYEKGMLDIQNREIVGLESLKSRVNAQMKRVPQAAIAGQATLVDIDKAIAGKELEQQMALAPKVTSESKQEGAKVAQQVTTGKDTVGSGLRSLPTPGQSEEYAIARYNKEQGDKLRDYAASGDLPTGEELQEVQSNERKMIAQMAKETHQPSSVVVGDLLRGVNALPTQMYPEGMSERKQDALRIMIEQGHGIFAKRFTPGALSIPEAYQHGMGVIMGQAGESPKMIKTKTLDMADLLDSKFNEMERVSKVGMAERRLPATNPGANPLQPPPFTQGQPAAAAAADSTATPSPPAKASPRMTSRDQYIFKTSQEILADPKASKEGKQLARDQITDIRRKLGTK